MLSQAFHFSVVIENIKADYYFSAKLINCFVHGVVPVYWGAPSISDFFNQSGIIVFNTLEQVYSVVSMRVCCFRSPHFHRWDSWTVLSTA
jgi:hypothetical protein